MFPFSPPIDWSCDSFFFLSCFEGCTLCRREGTLNGILVYEIHSFLVQLEPSYHGSSGGRPEGTSQPSGILRHSSMLGDPQEGDLGGYRGGHALLSAAPQHYGGGQYSSAYGAADQPVSLL